MRIYLAAIFILFGFILQAQVQPLAHGHAHNDYVHERPLFEALDNGFASIEIDVYLHKIELKVSHLPFGLDKKENIQQLYLEPIKKVIEQNGGSVYKGFKTPVIFMIDFKTDDIETYHKLTEILKNYSDFISVYRKDSVIHQRAINILISGNSPIRELIKEDSSVATIDGNISQLDDSIAGKVITRYSSSWERYFTWSGRGKMLENEKLKLDSLVTKTHLLGKQIRFYHIPDKPKVWKALLGAGVDWINTNRLREYRKFYDKEFVK